MNRFLYQEEDGSSVLIKDGLRNVFIIGKMPNIFIIYKIPRNLNDTNDVSIIFNPAPNQAREIAEQLMQYAKSVESGY